MKKKLKEIAENAFLAIFKNYNEQELTKNISRDIIQHNPFVATGRDALIKLLPTLKKTGISYTNHRILQDGDFVVMHNSFTNAQAFGSEKIVTFDIYLIKDDKAIEHWDAITPFSEKTASGRSQVDGETSIKDSDKTEANKVLTISFIEDVLMGKNPNKISEYINKNKYHQHNPGIKDGLSGILEAVQMLIAQNNMFKYKKIHKVLGEGNFVLTVSEGEWNNKPHAFYDLFRIENNKMVEHWDVIQEIPSEGLANNNSMFCFP